MPGDLFRTRIRTSLLDARNQAGHWRGELSSSALSTATAIIALSLTDRQAHASRIENGLCWLAKNQNKDGGWGDTILSYSNISTTLLCWAAFGAADADAANPDTTDRARTWIQNTVGSLEPARIAAKVVARYGKDKTFSVPILMACALGGRLGAKAWQFVPFLPFELAAFPRRWFAALQLPVVSYALPALIAIGQVVFEKKRTFALSPLRLARILARKRTLRILEEIQPASGGYLEATPLTSFVTMALAGCGHRPTDSTPAGRVMARAIEFLNASLRPDGSWPIDTDLATWVTTLSINALAPGDALSSTDRRLLLDWLLGQQYTAIHPFTQARPGAWAWTELTGGVPDADDTSGALIALRNLADLDPGRVRVAAEAGVTWLLDLQNRDGGIPTFCRGWGALPFDRSSNDITGHTLAAWAVWEDKMAPPIRARIQRATEDALAYLAKQQRADGALLPLWFGNQDVPDEENPTYGTARVLSALGVLEAREYPGLGTLRDRSAAWLLEAQNADGSWGGGHQSPSSIEETSLAVEALFRHHHGPHPATTRALAWLAETTLQGTEIPPSPIGFYFAKLWYYEALYPKIFLAGALETAAEYASSQLHQTPKPCPL
jgi:squalene-hopene/tetraprenyl-beta-curcumene cyclase